MHPNRWTTVAESSFPWEREALEFLREHLPDREPWRAWSNFEFIDDQGRVNEVDLLVLTPRGLILVEIKSRPGSVEGDNHSWTWNNEGRKYTAENPLPLANRKAKRLASLLRQQDAIAKSKMRAPFVAEVVFLSKIRPPLKLTGGVSGRVFLRGRPGQEGDNGIIEALTGGFADAFPWVSLGITHDTGHVRGSEHPHLARKGRPGATRMRVKSRSRRIAAVQTVRVYGLEELRARGAWSSSLLASGPPLEAKGADLSRPAEAPDPRAKSSRNGGRHHLGTVGGIISESRAA